MDSSLVLPTLPSRLNANPASDHPSNTQRRLRILLRNSNFDGTKLPIVAGRHQTTTDSVNLRFSKDRLVAQLAVRLGNSCPIRSSPRVCAMRNRSSEE